MGIENNLDVQIARFDPLIAERGRAIAAWGYYDPRAVRRLRLPATGEIPVASTLQQSRHPAREGVRTGTAGHRAAWSRSSAGATRSTTPATASRRPRSIQSLSPAVHDGPHAAPSPLPLLRDFLWSEPWLLVKTSQIVEERSSRAVPRGPDGHRAGHRDAPTGTWSPPRSGCASRTRASRPPHPARPDQGPVRRRRRLAGRGGGGRGRRRGARVRTGSARRTSTASAQDTLIDLVLGPNLTPDSTLEIQPTTIPDVVQYDVDAEAATAKAYENRPELAIAQVRGRAAAALNLKFAKNQRLPQLDAVGSYGYDGLAGRTNTSPDIFGEPPHADPGHRPHYADTDDDFFSSDGARSWSAGGVFSIPIGNVTARARRPPGGARAAPGAHPVAPRGAGHRARGPRRDPQPAVRAGGHRGRGAAPHRRRRSSSGPRGSASSTASRPPSTCSSARRTWWTRRARRSRRSRSTGTRWRPSTGPRAPSCETATSSSKRRARCGKIRATRTDGGTREPLRQEPGRPGQHREATRGTGAVGRCRRQARRSPLAEPRPRVRKADARQRRGGNGEHRKVDLDQGRSLGQRGPRGRGQRRRPDRASQQPAHDRRQRQREGRRLRQVGGRDRARSPGNVTGVERVQIEATGSVQGDVRTPRLVVQEGAILNGSVEMGPAAAPATPLTPARGRPWPAPSPSARAEPTPAPLAPRSRGAGGELRPRAAGEPDFARGRVGGPPPGR